MSNRSEFIRPSLLKPWHLIAIRKAWFTPPPSTSQWVMLNAVKEAYLRRYELAGQPEGELARELMHQANKAILLERLNPTFNHGVDP